MASALTAPDLKTDQLIYDLEPIDVDELGDNRRDRCRADYIRLRASDNQDLQDKVGGRRKPDHADPVLRRLIPVDGLRDLSEERHPDNLKFRVLLNARGGCRALPQVQEKPLPEKMCMNTS